MGRPLLLLIVAYCVSLTGITLVIGGYFSFHDIFNGSSSSRKHNLKQSIHGERQPIFGRLVYVVIDALRADMVLGDEALVENPGFNLSKHMLYTKSILREGKAKGYVTFASTPTVTMPRLKAMTTGRVPAFVDVLKNFNSQEIMDDNLLHRLNDAGFKGVFYGDDTWLKLFPNTFFRAEGTSGFFTKDTVQVDNNVTRHIQDELDPTMKSPKSKDWDYLILHYLGLDHVGHFRGPRSALMASKLTEMDEIIRRIHNAILAQDQLRRQANDSNFLPTLLVVCSDHGMTHFGNHGGSSDEETAAVVLFIADHLKTSSSKSSLFPPKKKMQVDVVPTISLLFGIDIPFWNTGCVLHDLWQLVNLNNTQRYLQGLLQNYHQLRQLFQDKNLAKDKNQDMEEDSLLMKTGNEIVHMMKLMQSKLTTIGNQYNALMIFSGILFILLSIISCSSRIYSPFSLHWMLLAGFGLHIISLSSTSSIENEHATWFFLCTSIFIIQLANHFLKILENRKPPMTQLFTLVIIIVCLRLVRNRNQVINFGRLNRIPFSNDNSVSVLTTDAAFPGAVQLYFFLIWILGVYKCQVNRHISGKFTCIIYSIGCYLACVHLGWNSATEVPSSTHDMEQQNMVALLVYSCCILVFACSFYCSREICFTHLELSMWLLFLLIHRASNIPTLALLMLLSTSLNHYLQVAMKATTRQVKTDTKELFMAMCIWCGQTAFYALGNSHVISTIDISGSYAGLASYNQVTVGCLTFLVVFTGPILFLFPILCLNLHENSQNVARFYFVIHQLQFLIYSLFVYFQRFHLFIWSVFIPKLLYQLAFALVMSTVPLVIVVVETCMDYVLFI